MDSVKSQVDALLNILEPLNSIPESQQEHEVPQALKRAALDLVMCGHPTIISRLDLITSYLISDLSKRAEVVKEKTTHAIRPAWMTRGSDEEALQDFVRTVEDVLKRFQVRFNRDRLKADLLTDRHPQLSQGNRIETYLTEIRQQTVAIREDVAVIKENTREIRRRGTATEKETNTILRHAQAIESRTDAIDYTTTATKVLTMVRLGLLSANPV